MNFNFGDKIFCNMYLRFLQKERLGDYFIITRSINYQNYFMVKWYSDEAEMTISPQLLLKLNNKNKLIKIVDEKHLLELMLKI